jgi:hypothetical protein
MNITIREGVGDGERIKMVAANMGILNLKVIICPDLFKKIFF